jgi:hypothetical protein
VKTRLFARCAVGAALVIPVLVPFERAVAEPLDRVVDVAPPYGGPGSSYMTGALPPGEIIASVRSAGFAPVTRPVQRGAIYVLRAVDRYDADVRVTVDARSGRVLAATRVARLEEGGPGYGGGPPPGYPPSYDRSPRDFGGYERAPVPPVQVPYGQGPYGQAPYEQGPPYGRGRIYGPPMGEPESLNVPSDRSGRPGSAAPVTRSAAVMPPHPPLPRARPDDTVTGSVTPAPPPASHEIHEATAPSDSSAAPAPAAPSPSGMVPIAPLE